MVGVPKAHVEPFVPRVTLTLPALGLLPRNAVRGRAAPDKRAILTRVLDGENLPANRARSDGETVWLVDQAALPEDFRGVTPQAPCALIVMGVSGSGKSTIAEALAERLGWRYEDGDSFHPASNVAKMSAGHPLTDEDRWPWLHAIADEIDRVCDGRRAHVVIACSALKRAYRDMLVHGRDDVRIVFLDGTQELIADRLAQRKGHFMPPGLLTSQFKTLEPPAPDEHPVTVSIDASVEAIVDDIVRQLRETDANRMTRIALVVSDVDGTLLTKDKILTDARQARGAAAARRPASASPSSRSRPDRSACGFLIEPLGDHAAGRRLQRQLDRRCRN